MEDVCHKVLFQNARLKNLRDIMIIPESLSLFRGNIGHMSMSCACTVTNIYQCQICINFLVCFIHPDELETTQNQNHSPREV